MLLENHAIANIFPMMNEDSFYDLVADIKQNGMIDPIVLYEGKILDGRNRYKAAMSIANEAKEPAEWHYHVSQYIDADPLGYVLSCNLFRRHLSDSERSMVAATMTKCQDLDGDALAHVCITNAAKMMNISKRSVNSALAIKNKGIKDLNNRVNAGEVSIKAGAAIANLTPEEQQKIVDSKAEMETAKKQRQKNKPIPLHVPRVIRKKPVTNFSLFSVNLIICEFCLNGEPGICQSEACILFEKMAPGVELINVTVLEEMDNLEFDKQTIKNSV